MDVNSVANRVILLAGMPVNFCLNQVGLKVSAIW